MAIRLSILTLAIAVVAFGAVSYFWQVQPLQKTRQHSSSLVFGYISLMAVVFFVGSGVAVLIVNTITAPKPRLALVASTGVRSQLAMANMVEAHGFAVEVAASLAELKAKASKARYDFALVDQALLNELGASRRVRTAHLFALSGRSQADTSGALYTGQRIADTLAKPLSSEALAALLQKRGLIDG